MSYDDDDCMGSSEIGRWKRDREIELDDQVYGVPAEERAVVEPCRPTSPLTTPALPGSFYVGRARAAGCDDEYDNEMERRFGAGW
jgi:hypothetical protein